MKGKKVKVRPVFIYLTILAVILGIVGGIILIRDFTGRAVEQEIRDIYSKEEVARHNSEQECWISMEGKVYDITLFLQIYPGKTLKGKCGGEVESGFFSELDRRILEKYEIGVLK